MIDKHAIASKRLEERVNNETVTIYQKRKRDTYPVRRW